MIGDWSRDLWCLVATRNPSIFGKLRIKLHQLLAIPLELDLWGIPAWNPGISRVNKRHDEMVSPGIRANKWWYCCQWNRNGLRLVKYEHRKVRQPKCTKCATWTQENTWKATWTGNGPCYKSVKFAVIHGVIYVFLRRMRLVEPPFVAGYTFTDKDPQSKGRMTSYSTQYKKLDHVWRWGMNGVSQLLHSIPLST